MSEKKVNFIYRFTLSALILVSLGINALSMAKVIVNKPNDYVFACVVIVVLSIFALFEVTLTIINHKKNPSLSKITLTERGYFNPIPFIAVILGAIIGLALSLTGSIIYFVKEDIMIKCNALVIFDVGFYLLINCIVYFLYILLDRKKTGN